jgi:hypothetical protein
MNMNKLCRFRWNVMKKNYGIWGKSHICDKWNTDLRNSTCCPDLQDASIAKLEAVDCSKMSSFQV